MLAASLPDLDGLGILVSEELYWDVHHRVGHCLGFGIVLAGLLAAMSRKRYALSFAVYLALFHLHLLMDFFGSGEGWMIHYFWPINDTGFKTALAWPLFSWQNITAFVALFIWTIGIARSRRRTPLELLMPSLNRKLVALAAPVREAVEA